VLFSYLSVLLLQLCHIFFFSRLVQNLICIIFPYTTLFRSRSAGSLTGRSFPPVAMPRKSATCCSEKASRTAASVRGCSPPILRRSEEHTSEIQSRENIVCRLLLEKKKHN